MITLKDANNNIDPDKLETINQIIKPLLDRAYSVHLEAWKLTLIDGRTRGVIYNTVDNEIKIEIVLLD